jgi:phosphofructokinase-like protein
MDRIDRVGILTGGGDCPGLNAVIRAVVRTADRFLPWDVVGILDGYEGLLRADGLVPLSLEDVRGLIRRGGTILGTSNRGDPFNYKAMADGEVRTIDRSGEVVERLRTDRIGALIVVGGDGSLRIAVHLVQLGVPIVGVPKTIDNDLSATDVTFGFDTAVGVVTEAIDRLHSTAESHHRVMLVEVMGRHAGWIALEAGLAGGADIVLIPEIPFTVDRVVAAIEERARQGRTSCIVVVAEGACPVGGVPILQPSSDPLAPPRLGGIGTWLADELGRRMTREVRATVLGHLQRGGTPSPFDRVLATRLGAAAAWQVSQGGFGRMVALRGTEIVSVPLAEAVGVRKTVPPCGERVMTARHVGISFGD